MSDNDEPRVGTYMTMWPHSIGRDQSLSLAAAMMRDHQVRHLPVLDGGQLVGVLSERDIALVEALAPLDPDRVSVEEAMTPMPYAVTPETPLSRVVRMMADHRYGCTVVMERGKVVGLFTTTDALTVLHRKLESDS